MKKFTKHLIAISAMVAICVGLFVSFSALKAEAATNYTSGNWTYTVSNNIATLTGYTGNSTNITLPATLGGYKVQSVGSSMFKNNTTITNATIPEGYTQIGESAFYNCSNLKSVTIPKSMKYIGGSSYTFDGSSFQNCIRLETVTFTQGGTAEARINDYTFSGCTALKSVIIPANYKTICENAFSGCTSLQSVEIKENSDKVTVRIIEAGAFKDCTALTSIVIPEGFTDIGESAFYNCSNLKSVTIPKSMKYIGGSSYTFDGSSFQNCIRLETVTFTQGGTAEARINDYTFSGCTALKTVIIPDNYKTLGKNSFDGCKSLTTIHIPTGVTSIGDNAFKNGSSSFVICSTSSDCTAKTYADKNLIKFKVCDGKHITAPAVTYTLSYNANGGSGAPSTQTGSASYIIPHSVPSRSGYTFLGWSKSSSATTATYFAGDTIHLTSNTVLYAVWQKNAVVTPPVTENKIAIEIKNNSGSKTINYGETLELTAIVTNKPEDATVVWYVDGAEKGEGEKFNVRFDSGTKTIEVKLVDAKGNTVTDMNGVAMTDSQTVTVKSGFFQKLISFLLNLFGINRTVVQSVFKFVF